MTCRWSRRLGRRRTMDRCAVLNAEMILSGAVELRVVHDGDGYGASVRSRALQLVSNSGAELLSQPFAAATPLSPSTRP